MNVFRKKSADSILALVGRCVADNWVCVNVCVLAGREG